MAVPPLTGWSASPPPALALPQVQARVPPPAQPAALERALVRRLVLAPRRVLVLRLAQRPVQSLARVAPRVRLGHRPEFPAQQPHSALGYWHCRPRPPPLVRRHASPARPTRNRPGPTG